MFFLHREAPRKGDRPQMGQHKPLVPAQETPWPQSLMLAPLNEGLWQQLVHKLVSHAPTRLILELVRGFPTKSEAGRWENLGGQAGN